MRQNHRIHVLAPVLGALVASAGCTATPGPKAGDTSSASMSQYASVRLTSDLSGLSEKQKKMLPLLIDAAKHMDALFWEQAFGPKESFDLASLTPEQRALFEANYGPWDRLGGNEPFLPGVGPKPLGARLYPEDMTQEEFEKYLADHPGDHDTLTSLYTIVRRKEGGGLEAVPYSVMFKDRLEETAKLLEQAAELAEEPGLATYLRERAKALVTDQYRDSDIAWLDMTDNVIEVIIGPIENYEDHLFNYKAAFEAYVMIKDVEWSKKLARFAETLPELQRGLPVPDEYKQETPGTDSQLNAYDAVYYAGDCNAGSKTIAVNLPNDPEVQLSKGTRRLQIKNVMRAKFDEIMVPIADVLIDPEQRKHVTFDAFFANTMFHEVAHGLGIKNTINEKGPVRPALKDEFSALEEGKADVLGLYMVTELRKKGEITEGELLDNYVTFLAGIFRSVRFGASSAHGRANMLRFNFFESMGAFSRDPATGTYRAVPDKMGEAVTELSKKILMLQGNGDYEGTKALMADEGVIKDALAKDLARLEAANIPVDVVFEQGLEVLGLGVPQVGVASAR